MKQDRILSYTQSVVLSQEQVESVSAAGVTSGICAEPTYQGSMDGVVDGHVDW